jgi:hypothetical protein
MSEEVLLALRALAAVLLYGFVAVALYALWRDYRAAVARTTMQSRPHGRLEVVQAHDLQLDRNAFPLFPLTPIGRAPTNVVVLPDSFASSQHATLTLRGGRWWLQDQGSANGTTLNGHPVTEATVIAAGDIIGVGRVLLRVVLD